MELFGHRVAILKYRPLVALASVRVPEPFLRLTLAQQFMLISFVILVAGALIIGNLVASEIEKGVVARTGAVTALYVDSFIADHLQELAEGPNISDQHAEQLDQLVSGTPLGNKIVALKIWSTDGRVLHANDKSLVGQSFPIGPGLQEALQGNVYSHVSALKEEENRLERQRWAKLVETYSPVRLSHQDIIIGVAEFYQLPDELHAEIAGSQQKGWLVVALATLAMYLLLNGMVTSASRTITAQNSLLAALNQKMRQVAARKLQTDESLLTRLALDLHDGPAQDLSLALLRLKDLQAGVVSQRELPPPEDSPTVQQDFALVQASLRNALKEIRQLASGLQLPDLESFSLAQVAEKAAREHEAKTGNKVKLRVGPLPDQVGMPQKIAVYRVIQESLNNAHHHGKVQEQSVSLDDSNGWIRLVVSDKGVGFDPDLLAPRSDDASGKLGLRGMRERVELLGGSLSLSTGPSRGTTILARLPLKSEEG